MIDKSHMDDQVTATERRVGDVDHPTGRGHVVALSRTYDAPIDDVWSACTEAKRISRWFMPVSGDLRLGGHYQLEGNAGGEILECEPPRRLKVTWIFGDPGPDDFSEVEVRLSPTDDGGTLLELEHRASVEDQFWTQFGPGSVGIGWELGLLGLAGYLRGTFVRTGSEEEELLASPEGQEFVRRTGEAWRAAHEASGADAGWAASAAAATVGFYLGEGPTPEEVHGGGDAAIDAGTGGEGDGPPG